MNFWQQLSSMYSIFLKIKLRRVFFFYEILLKHGDFSSLGGKCGSSLESTPPLVHAILHRPLLKQIFVFWICTYWEGELNISEQFLLKLENGTRRAPIPRKPLDPPISWIVTQSLIYFISYFYPTVSTSYFFVKTLFLPVLEFSP